MAADERKPVTIQIEVTLEDWAQRELEGRRGYEEPPTPEDLYGEVEDAITQRFGGDLHAKWINKGEREGEPIVIQGIEFPMGFSRDPTEFITPDWKEVIQFYPRFCFEIRNKPDVNEEPPDPQPFLLEFATALERRKAREGRTADMWIARIPEHFGMGWFMKAIEDMIGAKKEAMERKST